MDTSKESGAYSSYILEIFSLSFFFKSERLQEQGGADGERERGSQAGTTFTAEPMQGSVS